MCRNTWSDILGNGIQTLHIPKLLWSNDVPPASFDKLIGLLKFLNMSLGSFRLTLQRGLNCLCSVCVKLSVILQTMFREQLKGDDASCEDHSQNATAYLCAGKFRPEVYKLLRRITFTKCAFANLFCPFSDHSALKPSYLLRRIGLKNL